MKHCWSQVRVVNGAKPQPPPHPSPHFIVKNELLYCVAERQGELKELIVLPRSKTEMVLHLAHSHPFAGYLAAENTLQRIRDHFHWPGMKF